MQNDLKTLTAPNPPYSFDTFSCPHKICATAACIAVLQVCFEVGRKPPLVGDILFPSEWVYAGRSGIQEIEKNRAQSIPEGVYSRIDCSVFYA